MGTCVLDANQIGGFGYLAAPQVQQSFTVNQATPSTPTITNLPASGTYGGSFSGLDVSTTGDGTTSISASGACTVSGTTVSYDNGVGTCTLTAAVADGTDYTAATGLPQSFTVNQATPSTPTITNLPASGTYGGSFSGLDVSTTGDGTTSISASGACTVSGTTVSYDNGVGTCTLTAAVADGTDYTAATGLPQSFTVNQATPSTPTITNLPASGTYGGSFSGLDVSTTGDGTTSISASGACTVSGTTVSYDNGVGTCTLTAAVADGTDYTAATGLPQSFTVNQATPSTPTITNLPASGTYGGSFSGLDVSTTGDGTTSISASGACTVSGTTVSYDNGVGTCTLTAAVADGTDYTAATGLPQSFTVNQAGQAITFTSTRPSNAVVGGASYTVTATGGASLNPVTFSVGSSASSVCSISGSTVSSIGAGTCVIDANQGGDADYGPAPQVHQSFTVGQGTQTITFTSTPPSNATVAGPTYTVAVGGGESGKPVLTTIDATSKKVCSISGDIVSFIGAGTCTLDANQAGDANYKAAYQVQQSFKVSRAFQAITSPNSDTVAAGSFFTFAVTTVGNLVPSMTEQGKLPKHVTFVNNGNGTATISGTPSVKKTTVYHLTIKATFGKGKAKSIVTQAYTLTVTKS